MNKKLKSFSSQESQKSVVQTTYQTYKPSGIDWIGDVPKDWQVKRVKDFFSILGGNGFPDNEQGNETGEIPFLKVSDINSDNFEVNSSTNYVDSETVLKKGWNVIPAYSIVMGKIGEALKKNHRKINTVDCLIDNNMIAIKPSQKVNAKFAYYLLSIIDMDWFTNPGTIPAVSTVALKSSKVTMPDEQFQLSIANYLDDQTQKIDRLIANKKAQAEKLKELRQIEINNAVTKGLNPNAEMKDSGIEWLGKIPKHWEVKSLKNVAEFKYGESLNIDNRDDGDIPVYGSNGIVDNHSVAITKSPCIIIGRKGSYGKLNYSNVPCFPIDTTFYIDDSCTKFNINWLYYILQCLELDKGSQDSAVPGLSRELAYQKKLALPPKEEQIKIANYLQHRTTAIDQLIKNIEAQIEKLQELRKITIYEAVTGKVRTTDLND